MRQFRIAPRAQKDLGEIWDYIANVQKSPLAASSLLDRLSAKFSLLAAQPFMGQSRDDLRPGLRAFTAESYVVFYHVQADSIDVIGVVHAARDIEGLFRAGQR